MSLKDKLLKALDGVSGTYGVAVKHLGTGETACINEKELFQTASACKVAILATLFSEAEKGHLSLDSRLRLAADDLVPGSGVLQKFDAGVELSVKDLATMMIIVSDNLATDKILEMIGKDKVNQLTKELGLAGMHLEHSIWDLLSLYVDLDPKSKSVESYAELEELVEGTADHSGSSIFDMSRKNNVSTPYEMNELLEKMAKKTLVSEDASEKMIDILKSQQFGHRLPHLLPDGVEVANKTGTIGSVVNDAGIVYMADHQGCFVITVLSRDNATHIEGEETIARLSKTAYDHFTA
ncbi:MAG TPA: serine hydrolase [Bacillales bacterium]|nr:serine hydrolase [Bacillales bacterium]